MFFRLKRTTKIAQLTEGKDVVIEGTIVAEKKALTIPKTTLQCVYYDVLYEAFERGARGAGRKMWVPKSAEQKACTFYVVDGEDRVRVLIRDGRIDASGLLIERGMTGKQGRFVARFIPAESFVRVGGRVEVAQQRSKDKELVLVPNARGILQLHRKR